MKQIDHDPSEPPRPLRGEAIFVAIVTVVSLVCLRFLLLWVKDDFGLAWFAAAVILFIGAMFAIAFRWEAKKKQARELQRQKLGLRSDQ